MENIMKKFLTGSSVFFSNYDDFNPQDKDYLILKDRIFGDKKHIHIKRVKPNECIYVFKYEDKSTLIEWFKLSHLPKAICMFLTTEVSEYIGFTIDELKELKDYIVDIDDRHKYLIDIYNSYVENESFSLTDEQRLKAYETYKNSRT